MLVAQDDSYWAGFGRCYLLSEETRVSDWVNGINRGMRYKSIMLDGKNNACS